jgi:type IV fimbrial biogenesis protein FimT
MPSRALTRRDPPNGKKEFSTKNGFTVIEMMITLAILAIITALALPSYRAIIEKRKVTSAAEQAMAFVSSAQLESVKRNRDVAVHFKALEEGASIEWCLGMTDQPGDCDCLSDACEIDGAPRSFQSKSLGYRPDAKSIDVPATQFPVIVFDPVRGLTRGSETAQLALISPDQAMYALNVELSPTGRVKICTSARGSMAVPGFEPCNDLEEPDPEG